METAIPRCSQKGLHRAEDTNPAGQTSAQQPPAPHSRAGQKDRRSGEVERECVFMRSVIAGTGADLHLHVGIASQC